MWRKHKSIRQVKKATPLMEGECIFSKKNKNKKKSHQKRAIMLLSLTLKKAKKKIYIYITRTMNRKSHKPLYYLKKKGLP